MSNEEKLKQLLQIACKNGWTPDNAILEEINYVVIGNKSITCWNVDDSFLCWTGSLNDLVTNWEEGEVSFIEALCKSTKNKLSFNDYQYWLSQVQTEINFDFTYEELIFLWNFKFEYLNGGSKRIIQRPTSEKIDWLFETFKHLLNEI